MNYITPRLWIAKGDSIAECNVGVELADLALQYSFFPQLILELGDDLFKISPIEKLNNVSY